MGALKIDCHCNRLGIDCHCDKTLIYMFEVGLFESRFSSMVKTLIENNHRGNHVIDLRVGSNMLRANIQINDIVYVEDVIVYNRWSNEVSEKSSLLMLSTLSDSARCSLTTHLQRHNAINQMEYAL